MIQQPPSGPRRMLESSLVDGVVNHFSEIQDARLSSVLLQILGSFLPANRMH